MNALYQINTVVDANGSIHSNVLIDPRHLVFKGHFPGRPIMPGVCMIQMVQDALTQGLQKEFKLKSITSVKFSKMWLPDQFAEAQINLTYEMKVDELKIKTCTLFNGDIVFFKLKAGYYVIS